MKFFLDTSIVTAYYWPEARSERVQRLLTRIERPAVSPLVEIELFCVIARKARAREIDASAAQRIFAKFQSQLAVPRFYVVPVQAGEYALAREWITDMSASLRSVDALHLATASNSNLVLVTADRDLARAAKHFDVKHQLVS